MKETKEPGTETESQCLRCFRNKCTRCIVKLKFIKRITQLSIIVRFDGIYSSKDHRLGMLVPRQRVRGGSRGTCDRISHATLMHGFETGSDITPLPCSSRLDRLHVRREDTDFDRTHVRFGGEHAQYVIVFERAFNNTNIGDHALVGVVMRVEDQGTQR